MLEPGAKAPDFEAPLALGGTFRLRDQLAKSEVLLYFFPKTFTPT